jgi:hypothetical protein
MNEAMISILAATAILSSQAAPAAPVKAAPVLLNRVMKKGDKFVYDIKSDLVIEEREYGLETFLPSGQGFEYRFTMDVLEEKVDGIVTAMYTRPTMTEIFAETHQRSEVRRVEKTNWKIKLDVSPLNELLKFEDMTPKPPAKKNDLRFLASTGTTTQQNLPYVDELYRLALFVGSLDSSLDFNPKLPFEEVQVGEEWKKTVSYQPQKVKGSNKQAVQRLDYVYTYKGVRAQNGKNYYHVQATLKLDTDAGEFINQSLGMKPSESGLKALRLKFNAVIDFNLDMKTCTTVSATAKSEGSYKLEVTTIKDEAQQEGVMRGESTMRLVKAQK